jgi:hypothetical protein
MIGDSTGGGDEVAESPTIAAGNAAGLRARRCTGQCKIVERRMPGFHRQYKSPFKYNKAFEQQV